MDSSIFTGQFQSTMYNLVFEMMEKMVTGETTEAGSAVTSPYTFGSRSGSGAAVSGDFASLINAAAEKYDVDAELINAVIKAESNYNAAALSSAGAGGLMQLMPGTAEDLGVSDPYNIEQNIQGGAQYLSEQLQTFGGDLSLALAAYNAGPNAVKSHGGVPPFQETKDFIDKVLTYYSRYRVSGSETR